MESGRRSNLPVRDCFATLTMASHTLPFKADILPSGGNIQAGDGSNIFPKYW